MSYPFPPELQRLLHEGIVAGDYQSEDGDVARSGTAAPPTRRRVARLKENLNDTGSTGSIWRRRIATRFDDVQARGHGTTRSGGSPDESLHASSRSRVSITCSSRVASGGGSRPSHVASINPTSSRSIRWTWSFRRNEVSFIRTKASSVGTGNSGPGSRLADIRCGQQVVWADLLAGEHHVNRASAPTLAVRPRRVDAVDVLMDEADRAKFGDHPIEIVPFDEQVHVLGVPHRLLIGPGNPRGHGVASDDDVGDSRPPERACCATSSLSNVFHGRDHPFPGEILQNDIRHAVALASRIVPATLPASTAPDTSRCTSALASASSMTCSLLPSQRILRPTSYDTFIRWPTGSRSGRPPGCRPAACGCGRCRGTPAWWFSSSLGRYPPSRIFFRLPPPSRSRR